jgi:hypothetical protein
LAAKVTGILENEPETGNRFLAGKKFEWCRVAFSIMSVGKVSSHFFPEDFVKLKARKRATGGQSYQKLQIFVACTVCILVKFYRYFLAGQVFTIILSQLF